MDPVRLGPYRLEGVLGSGGMGLVYRGYDERLDRPVALKRVHRPNDEDARHRLRREARSLAQLNHPAVVQVYDLVEGEDGDWIVMELVEGQTLAELAGTEGLAPAHAVELARQVAEGLGAAHDRDLIHRDLKTENVMAGVAGGLKILDFGLAHRIPGPSSPQAKTKGRVVGTVRALSPEQILGHPIDARSDLFALGTLLYEILTGRSPFLGKNHAETMRQICATAHLPAHTLRPEIPARLSRLIDDLLAKEPELRLRSAAAVARRLERLASDLTDQDLGADALAPQDLAGSPTNAWASHADATTLEVRREAPRAFLRAWPPPELPAQPYPVLLPYTHPELMAGRGQELKEIRTALRLPVPIYGLSATSGTGKSSLLLGGLVPGLRADGVPVAVVRHPQETGVAARLLGDLLDGINEPVADEDWRGFVRQLCDIERLARTAPLLVLDQIENVLHDEAAGPRARLGVLLAATVQRRPGVDAPLCRWLLICRQEFHGDLLAWLDDILADDVLAEDDVLTEDVVAGSTKADGALRFLPYHLSGPERFHNLTLSPFATPSPGGEAMGEAREIFQAAIEKPLRLQCGDGKTPRYALHFAPGHAERLAHAFATARRAHPEASLLPEFQVVLAHLVARADLEGRIVVPEDPGDVVGEALTDHLRQGLEAAFPAGSTKAETRRAQALLALRELASTTGRRDEGLPAEDLARAIGENGAAILERLATPLTRFVVRRDAPAGPRYVLSHDRLAEVVVRMVEEEGRHRQFSIDAELLALRRFVSLETALYGSAVSDSQTEIVATRIPRRHYRTIAAHAETLLWNDAQHTWWTACQRRRRIDLLQSAVLGVVVLILCALMTWGTGSWVDARERRQALRDQVVQGEPGEALRTLHRLADEPDTTADDLLVLLRRRKVPMDVLEHGLSGVQEAERGAAVLQVVEIALPWVLETPDDPILIANLVWALDYGPGRDERYAARTEILRNQVLQPLRDLRPPPEVQTDDPDWVSVPAGTFQMGSDDPKGPPMERPQHQVTVSAFWIQRHEVTNAEYRLLAPAHPGEDDLPALPLSWHKAYTYAAWRGGRLPTEAEWEYAARADCPWDYCTRDGLETTVDDVAWTLRNATDPETGTPMPSPVMRLEPNPWGLYDMLGNSWEWTADWYTRYEADEAGRTDEAMRLRNDPWGPATGDGRRVIRGGAFGSQTAWARVAFRLYLEPDMELGLQGLRVVVP